MERGLPETEQRSERSAGLDRLGTREMVSLLIADQHAAAQSVDQASEAMARVVDAIADRLSLGGRLHYVGAGTSGRLAVLDASEMPPTFGVAPDLVCAHIAGGDAALRQAVEGAEDDAAAGDAQMRERVFAGDAVIGISASGSARFVCAALARAKAIGAYTATIVNVRNAALAEAADECIVLATGAEVVAGSTRLKAGTAQKIALNTISTAVMVRLGKVYENLMVDVVASNDKLRARSMRLVKLLTGCDDDQAFALLEAAEGRVKVAVVMAKRSIGADRAAELLARCNGFLRELM